MEKTTMASSFLLPMASLCEREIVRFFRQKSRVVGTIGTPLVFWLLIGSGFGTSFRAADGAGGADYLQYFFAGTAILIVLFGSIFSTISIIEDRREGFLQSVLVAPVSRLSIVLGKVLGGSVITFLQGFIFLLLAPLLGMPLEPLAILSLAGVLFLVAFELTSLGFCIAWGAESTQGFHAIMNLFLIPLWLLSGALFPASGAPAWLQGVIKFNPLSYGVAAVRHILEAGRNVKLDPTLPSLELSLGVTVVVALAIFGVAVLVVSRRRTKYQV